MTQNEYDWLKLHIAVTAGVKTCAEVGKAASVSELFSDFYKGALSDSVYDAKFLSALKSADDKKTEEIIEICKKNGWGIITPDSLYYPEKLKGIKDYPFALFYSGNPEYLTNEPKISVVGTRNPSDKGLMAAYTLACCLSSLGVTTVSGGAQGIDASVHEGSLTDNGGTVAVLGTGLGADYLPVNSFMRHRIEKNGVLVSEFLPFTPPTRFSFPRRNRIISALSDITVVTESGEKGGSLITADYALKQGRKVFCFDESIVKSPGCSALIKNGIPDFETPEELLSGCDKKLPPLRRDGYYLTYDLHNDGIKGVHITKPSCMTADSFALYNGITPAEAREKAGYALKKSVNTLTTNEKNANPENVKTDSISEKKKTRKKSEAVPKKTEMPKKTEKIIPDYLSDEAKNVYAVLCTEPVYFDEIQFKTSLPAQDVMTAVTELELEELAVLYPGNKVGKL